MQTTVDDLSALFSRQYHCAPLTPRSRVRTKVPAAVCTRCSAFSFRAEDVAQSCTRISHGRLCTGVLSSPKARGGWHHCVGCAGTGWQLGRVCLSCQSLGWQLNKLN